MKAQVITDRQQWDDFIAQSVCCNITQSYGWGELSDGIGSETLRMGVVDDAGKLCAAMLIFIDRIPVLRRTYFYAPRGPVIDDPTSPAMIVLLMAVKREAHRRNAFMLKIEPSVPDGDQVWLSALRKHGFRPTPYFTHVRHEWVLNLQPDEKEILAGMKDKWRYNIRLASRKGITVRRAEGAADIEAFFKLYQITSQRDQFFIQPSAQYYADALRYLGEDDHAVIFLAEYEGKPIAGAFIAYLGRWSWYVYGASANEHREKMPNHLVQWTSMQWAKSKGCWYYNFRGIPDVLEEGQDTWGVYLFKRGFGGYPLRFLETHDLAYQPMVYQAYKSLLDVKRWRDEQQRKKRHAARQEEKQASKPEEKKTDIKS